MTVLHEDAILIPGSPGNGMARKAWNQINNSTKENYLDPQTCALLACYKELAAIHKHLTGADVGTALDGVMARMGTPEELAARRGG